MFVPGVNGSVIPSAPSGSKLKSAYKNSKNLKKRKMPNGGSTGLGMALEAATYVPGPIGTYASGASALANLYQGDYVGAGLDALNMATFGTAKGLMGVARAANAIRPYSNLAVNAAQASRSVNRVAKKVAPVTRAAGTINQFTSSPYNNTMRVPQRDNTQVQFRPNPNMRRMEEGGTLPPRYTSNPRDPRLRSYNDSLSLYNQYLKPAEINKTLKEIKNDSRFRYYRPSNRTELNNFPGKIKPILGTEFDFSRIDADLISGRSTKHNYYPTYDSSGRIIPGEIGTHLSFKKPVQPYIYKKPEVVPEVIETPVVPAVPVVPVAEPPVKKIGYVKPVIQQFNYMSNENKAKALQKYGSVSDIPFKGVDINQLKKGGEVEDDDDKEMVEGVASILRDVKSKKNRLQLANKLAKQFNREKVEYNLADFLNKSKVKK